MKTGPRPLPPDLKRTSTIHVVLRPGERAAVEQQVREQGTTISALGRTALLREVRRLQRRTKVA